MLLEKTYKSFIRGGAALEREKQERLREINSRMSVLTLQFGDNIRDETNSLNWLLTTRKIFQACPETS
jgi:peptidyl-dipeptidase Dcp